MKLHFHKLWNFWKSLKVSPNNFHCSALCTLIYSVEIYKTYLMSMFVYNLKITTLKSEKHYDKIYENLSLYLSFSLSLLHST